MAGEIRGVDSLVRSLAALPSQARSCARRGLERAALLVHRDAIAYAPRSPSAEILKGLRKTTRDTSKQKRPRATSRPKPGGLERSISFGVDMAGLDASVYVASNAEGGQYAVKMHDERGKSWQNLGPGSIAKGGRVGDKFIERALADNQANVESVLREELERGLKL